MKKSVAIIILIVLLLLMSSAYAVWTDSVSVNVTAANAVISVGYTDRNSNPQKVQYTIKPSGPLSTTNPYIDIEETVSRLKYKNNQPGINSVTYTITNIGDVPITFDGITVLSKSVNYSSPVYTDTIRIEYSVSNTFAIPAYNYTGIIADFNSFTGINFSSSEGNVLDVGEYCTLTVSYYRIGSGDKDIDKTELIITKTDQLSCSVYR